MFLHSNNFNIVPRARVRGTMTFGWVALIGCPTPMFREGDSWTDPITSI